jgi:hypothetical protein
MTLTTTATLTLTQRPAAEITAEGLRIFNDHAVVSVNYEAAVVGFIRSQIEAAGLQGCFSWN